VIPKDYLAFQIGETVQLMSGAAVEATPHCVTANEEIVGKRVSRNTLAVFHQPSAEVVLSIPKEGDREKALKTKPNIPEIGSRFRDGMTFAEFSVKTLKQYS
jgi:isopenicillin N synthase-like dioxygenase